MRADAMEKDRADVWRNIGEAGVERRNDLVVERVALVRPVQADHQHRPDPLQRQQTLFACPRLRHSLPVMSQRYNCFQA